MKKTHNTKYSIKTSIVSLLLCFSMLLGTTYAWFTDSVTSSGNIIQSGNLDIGMYWSENNTDWHDAEGANSSPVFSYDNWEPGYTEVRYIKVTNEGSLSFKYQMTLSPNGEVENLAEVIDVYYDIVTGNDEFIAPNSADKQGSLTKVGNLKELIESDDAVAGGVLLPANELSTDYYSGEIVVCISFHMQEQAGNEYQGKSIGTTFDIKLYATQYDYENDSFDNSYDDEAEWPDLPNDENVITAPVNLNSDGSLASAFNMGNEDGTINTTLGEGFKFKPGTTAASLNVNPMNESQANIVLAENESSKSYDIHIENVAEDNTVPAEIAIKEFFAPGLNEGNLAIYHVENGVTIPMTRIAADAEGTHNTFKYDPATGNVTVYLASFSEIVLVASQAEWKGNYDDSWYDANASEYTIANGDQLAAFGAIVGGMNGYARDSFTGKTVHLAANVNLGDYDLDNNDLIFYPIGYYYNGNKDDPYSTVWSFEGTFDGHGHKISNFYQNTWEIPGDYEGQYYKDAMGLFGYLVGATVKNLTVDNFSSDGEFTPTGVIAAYASNSSFSNIAITNCNPRVYNTGNGGIVGIGGNSDDPDTYELRFTNITIDNTNKITALWGSWDVACGGLVGMFRGAGHVHMINCHVGAQIDVYNDVCGNYQYYWYRYAGMLIGTNKNMITEEDGSIRPETEKFHAIGCTVHFGDWNNYYYCELVANSLASYTHDHQFSRLTQVDDVDVNRMTVTVNGETTAIPTSGRYNYVVLTDKDANGNWVHGDENATCYHFVDGEQWKHEQAGTEVIDGKEILKEDRQHYYLPFNQLFTGYGWGVEHVPIYNDETANPFKGVTILDRKQADSVEKFEGRKFNSVTQNGILIEEGILSSPISGRHYKLGHIFSYLEDAGVPVITGALTVTVTNLDENGNVTASLTRDTQNWEDITLVFSGKGKIILTIQDYYYCTPTSIEIQVREYPEGSKIRNFTYDGFGNGEDHHFSGIGDHITNGKHGVYECDFGYGPEVLDYAHKFDSRGKIVFTAPADGSYTIAYASLNANAGIRYRVKGENEDDSKYGSYTTLDIIKDPYELHVAKLEMEAGKTYEFTRVNKECGVYYVGYVPYTSIPGDHSHIYYEDSTADCEKGGNKTEMCMICGKTNTYNGVPALGHDWANEPGYPSTCEDTGKNPGEYCARCNKVNWGCESTPAHGHNYVNGFCHCVDEACHRPQQINNIIAGVDFTKGNNNDYSDFGTFFKPNGNCNMSNDNTYLIMKAYTILDENNQAGSTVFHHSYIEFTVTQDATFYVRVASTDRGNTSKFVLQDANGTQIESVFHSLHSNHSTPVVEVTGVSGHTVVYTLKAGTYRFYCTSTERVGRIMNMVVSYDVLNLEEVLRGLTPST